MAKGVEARLRELEVPEAKPHAEKVLAEAAKHLHEKTRRAHHSAAKLAKLQAEVVAAEKEAREAESSLLMC